MFYHRCFLLLLAALFWPAVEAQGGSKPANGYYYIVSNVPIFDVAFSGLGVRDVPLFVNSYTPPASSRRYVVGHRSASHAIMDFVQRTSRLRGCRGALYIYAFEPPLTEGHLHQVPESIGEAVYNTNGWVSAQGQPGFAAPVWGNLRLYIVDEGFRRTILPETLNGWINELQWMHYYSRISHPASPSNDGSLSRRTDGFFYLVSGEVPRRVMRRGFRAEHVRDSRYAETVRGEGSESLVLAYTEPIRALNSLEHRLPWRRNRVRKRIFRYYMYAFYADPEAPVSSPGSVRYGDNSVSRVAWEPTELAAYAQLPLTMWSTLRGVATGPRRRLPMSQEGRQRLIDELEWASPDQAVLETRRRRVECINAVTGEFRRFASSNRTRAAADAFPGQVAQAVCEPSTSGACAVEQRSRFVDWFSALAPQDAVAWALDVVREACPEPLVPPEPSPEPIWGVDRADEVIVIEDSDDDGPQEPEPSWGERHAYEVVNDHDKFSPTTSPSPFPAAANGRDSDYDSGLDSVEADSPQQEAACAAIPVSCPVEVPADDMISHLMLNWELYTSPQDQNTSHASQMGDLMAARDFGPDSCADALYSPYGFDRHPRRKRAVDPKADPNSCCALRNQMRTKLCSTENDSKDCLSVDGVNVHVRFASYWQGIRDAAMLRFSQASEHRATLLVEISSPPDVTDGVISRQVDLGEVFGSETVALAKLSNISIFWGMREPSKELWKMQDLSFTARCVDPPS
ncbi:hypothetical protein GQ602_006571 [Ophiocordyceps camponoti-floridani]|uniref:Enterotoxin n=1 Tax=Ophiocordyceps camponoti-floridani TaxID=2030778 RepID=A0A8H4Q1F9_9HYPO|nr:hypothetical protein GQ602_006571 [Ophiocordyceps camponoti-floridani]